MQDLISRRAAIDALDKRFDDVPMELTTEILLLRKDLREVIPSAQPEERTNERTKTHACDLIDRQAALDEADEWLEFLDGDKDASLKMGIRTMRASLRKLPSVQPERKTGHWEIYVISMLDGEDVRCPKCGQRGCAPYWKYCPNCGEKKEGVQNGTD